ncbi:hypothetical protein MBLNU459_g4178t1 [Dothideomycetes sp. NU459]
MTVAAVDDDEVLTVENEDEAFVDKNVGEAEALKEDDGLNVGERLDNDEVLTVENEDEAFVDRNVGEAETLKEDDDLNVGERLDNTEDAATLFDRVANPVLIAFLQCLIALILEGTASSRGLVALLFTGIIFLMYGDALVQGLVAIRFNGFAPLSCRFAVFLTRLAVSTRLLKKRIFRFDLDRFKTSRRCVDVDKERDYVTHELDLVIEECNDLVQRCMAFAQECNGALLNCGAAENKYEATMTGGEEVMLKCEAIEKAREETLRGYQNALRRRARGEAGGGPQGRLKAGHKGGRRQSQKIPAQTAKAQLARNFEEMRLLCFEIDQGNTRATAAKAQAAENFEAIRLLHRQFVGAKVQSAHESEARRIISAEFDQARRQNGVLEHLTTYHSTRAEYWRAKATRFGIISRGRTIQL